MEKIKRSYAKKVKKVKLNADAYLIEWCEEKKGALSANFSFSENTLNRMLNVVLAPDTHLKKNIRLIIKILDTQDEVVGLSDEEKQIIIRILV